MGTHPIFESDFDCLTDGTTTMSDDNFDLAEGWEGPILCSNRIGDRCKRQFVYIGSNQPTTDETMEQLEASLPGCSGPGGSTCECGQMYKQKGDELILVDLSSNAPLYECNTNCNCNPLTCSNRLVQNGCQRQLMVKLTQHGFFGLFAVDHIQRGAFIIEYIGELVTPGEARGRHAQGHGDNYILAARVHFDGVNTSATTTTIVDARHQGNAARFANHSCSPNAALIPVHIDNHHPRIALFAKRQIAPTEEIVYAYGTGVDGLSDTPCLCQSSSCVGFMPRENIY